MAIRLHKALEFLCCQTTMLPLELPGWNVVVSTLRPEFLDKEIGEISDRAVWTEMKMMRMMRMNPLNIIKI